MVLVRSGGVEDEGALWAHEYGHNAGLTHNPDSSYIMHACQCGGNRGLTQVECGKFWTPTVRHADRDDQRGRVHRRRRRRGAGPDRQLPAIGNNDQIDSDDDGVGDTCEGLPIADGDTEQDADRYADRDADVDSERHLHSDANADADRDADGDTNRDDDHDSVSDADRHADSHCDTDSHAYAHRYATPTRPR